MSDVLITEFMDEAAVAALSADLDVDYDPGLADTQADIPARLTGARALIVRNRTQVSADLLAAAPNLVCVGRLGVGLDNIDQVACKARGVTVYPATGANNLSVVEYVITTALMLMRGAYQTRGRMIAGDWPRQALSGREVSGKRLGLVGFGRIARDVAAPARALGMKVGFHDPYFPADHPGWPGVREYDDLDKLLAEADVVSLHVPLVDETRHLINAARIARMKPGAVLINAARGGVVDEPAVADALRSGHLGGAALDVFEAEPLSADGARIFQGLDNLILTPHIAGVTEQSNERVSAMIARAVRDHLRAN